jgi:hypothetical protein
VAKNQPAEYVTICALLVPKEMKAEHFGGLSALTDEELDAALDALREMLAARAGEAANVIEGTAERPETTWPQFAAERSGVQPWCRTRRLVGFFSTQVLRRRCASWSRSAFVQPLAIQTTTKTNRAASR